MMTLHRRRFLVGLLACPLCAEAAQSGAALHWEYKGVRGADRWGDLDDSFRTCAIGSEQSPIELKNAISARIDRLVLDWKPQAFEIVNTGHTIQANAVPGSGLQIGAERYELRQFHFHTPSEHALNGARSAMEVHFLHAHPSGRFAAVGAFLTSGGINAAFTQIMSVAPVREGSANLQQPLDPTTLVPAEGGLYRYEGSLSTPPCSEIVEWNVFGLPVAVAEADIAAFRKLYPHNARPLQPVNRRFVLQRD